VLDAARQAKVAHLRRHMPQAPAARKGVVSGQRPGAWHAQTRRQSQSTSPGRHEATRAVRAGRYARFPRQTAAQVGRHARCHHGMAPACAAPGGAQRHSLCSQGPLSGRALPARPARAGRTARAQRGPAARSRRRPHSLGCWGKPPCRKRCPSGKGRGAALLAPPTADTLNPKHCPSGKGSGAPLMGPPQQTP
jgi:hypothetical protein